MENTKIINGTTYVFSHVMPEDLIDVQVGIARVIGEPLFKAFLGINTSEEEQAAAGAVAIGLMMSNINPVELRSMMRTMFKYTGIGGEKTKLDLNADFQGKPKEAWQVFLAALQFNLADFIPAALLRSVSAVAEKLQ
jgi:hypothetical protein